MKVIKLSDGEYYLCRGKNKKDIKLKDWWLIKHFSNINSKCGILRVSKEIYFPKELIGKKVRVKIEVLVPKKIAKRGDKI